MSKDKKLCTIYIVRHGETEWNKQKRIQGQLDSPLTQEAIQQAKDFAQKTHTIQFDAVFSSDLLRAQKTAEIISLDHQLVVQATAALRERQLGIFEGKTEKQIIGKMRQLLDRLNEVSLQEKQHNGYQFETLQELENRIFTFLREVAIAYAGQTILCVSHGATMRSLLVKLGFASFSELPPNAIENLGHIVLQSDGTEFFVKKTVGVKKRIIEK